MIPYVFSEIMVHPLPQKSSSKTRFEFPRIGRDCASEPIPARVRRLRGGDACPKYLKHPTGDANTKCMKNLENLPMRAQISTRAQSTLNIQ